MVQPFTTFVRAYRNTFLIVFHVAKHVIEKLLDMVSTNKLGINNRITAHKNNSSSFECSNILFDSLKSYRAYNEGEANSSNKS